MRTNVVVAFAILSCAVSSRAQTAACKLLSTGDVTVALHVQFPDGKPMQSPQGDDICYFRTQPGITVSVAVQRSGGAAKFEQMKAKWTRQAPDRVETVQGIGERAFMV